MTTTDTGPQTAARRGGVAADDLRAAIDLISRHRTRDDPGPFSMKADLDVALETAYGAGIAEARRLTVERLRSAAQNVIKWWDAAPPSFPEGEYVGPAIEGLRVALAQEETRA